MKIFSIELENYRQYRGSQKIEFTGDDRKNFIVIQGANGAGKTNLLNAITWCLYGKEEHLAHAPTEQMMSKLNEKVATELEPGESAEVNVKVVFGNDKPRYIFKRSVKAIKDKEGNLDFVDQEPEVWFFVNEQWEQSKQPQFTVNVVLPEGIKDFFFFDGEKLDDFFKQGSNEKVKQAILDVSQIDLLGQAMEHLQNKRGQIAREAKGLSPKADEILAKIEAANKPLSSNKEKLEGYKKQKLEASQNLGQIEEKLRDVPLALVKELQRQREDISKKIDYIESRRREVKAKSLDNLIKTAPLIYTFRAILKAKTLIDEKYRVGDLPPGIRDTFVESLLKKGKCICGTNISQEGVHRANVQKYLKVAEFSKIDQQITQGKFRIDETLKRIHQFIPEQERIGKDLRDREEEANGYRERLKEISARIGRVDLEEVQRLENMRIEFASALMQLEGEIRVTEADIERSDRMIREWEREHKREIEKEEKHAHLKSRLDLCDKALSAMDTVRKELIDEVRRTVEARMKECFLSLIWKKETYADVKIDDSFRVSVISKLRSESLGSLSAGERQILALSFMAALKEVSGFEAPVVIDTPLGRISGEPKDNIAESLPEYLRETQVTLLVTDQEYSSSVREKLAKRVCREFKLEFDEENSETRVVPNVSG